MSGSFFYGEGAAICLCNSLFNKRVVPQVFHDFWVTLTTDALLTAKISILQKCWFANHILSRRIHYVCAEDLTFWYCIEVFGDVHD